MTTNDELLALRSRFPALAEPIAYFDHAYTGLVPWRVLFAARAAAISRFRRTPDDVAGARARVAAHLNAHPDEIRFVPGGTTQALALVAARLKLSPYDRVIASAAEHRAMREPWGRSRLEMARVDTDGLVSWPQLAARLPGARVLAVALASNVTGAIAPIAELARAARDSGALTVVDAAQAAPHLPIDVRALGVDALAFSSHKAWGLAGVGVLWGRADWLDQLGLDQAGLEDALPYEAVMALPEALDTLAAARTPGLTAHRARLGAYIDTELRALPDARVLGPADPTARIPLWAIAGAGRSPEALAHALAKSGIRVRAGQHRAEPLHASVGLESTLRISAHTLNTLDEAERLLVALKQAWGG
ncbi:MAG: aminotransferase class V-fold PLP-dependent enzyme [Candidatus Sericytochromatia bacterium]